MVGGNGADFVNGGVGTDVEVLGNGDDTAAWNPGEGNDAIDGGLGRDTLAFNGSNGDEQMSLSANGESAVFLRNLANIRMDLDGVERLDLATFGGADTVTIGDLSGTDVTTAEVDLAATTGAADAKDDTVQVNGSEPVRPGRRDRRRRHGRGLRADCPDQCHRRRHDRPCSASTPSAATTGSRSATPRAPCSTSRPTSGPTSDQSPGLVTGLRPSSTTTTPTPTRRSP